MKERRERTQINKIINEKRKITTDTIEMQRIIRGYYDHPYTNKLDNLEEMEKSLKTCSISRLN